MEYDIVSGALSPGAKVPSVRELASVAAVNPNTIITSDKITKA